MENLVVYQSSTLELMIILVLITCLFNSVLKLIVRRSCVLITAGSERVNLVMHLNVTNNYSKFYFIAANFSVGWNFSSAREAEILFQLQDESQPGLNPSPCYRQFDFWRICFRSQDEFQHVIRPLEFFFLILYIKNWNDRGVYCPKERRTYVKNARRPVKRKDVIHVINMNVKKMLCH